MVGAWRPSLSPPRTPAKEAPSSSRGPHPRSGSRIARPRHPERKRSVSALLQCEWSASGTWPQCQRRGRTRGWPSRGSSGTSTSAGRFLGDPGGRFGMYLRTVLGETRIPSLSSNSLAIRSSPAGSSRSPSCGSVHAVPRESGVDHAAPSRAAAASRLRDASAAEWPAAQPPTRCASRTGVTGRRDSLGSPRRFARASCRARCTARADSAGRGSRPEQTPSSATARSPIERHLRSDGL